MIPVRYHEAHAASTRPAIRYLLGSLLAFGALNAFAGGYYGLAGAEGVPREWLEGTPFKDYFYPSLILLVVVGGSCLVAAAAVFARPRVGRLAAFAAAAVLLIWLAAELLMLAMSLGCSRQRQPQRSCYSSWRGYCRAERRTAPIGGGALPGSRGSPRWWLAGSASTL